LIDCNKLGSEFSAAASIPDRTIADGDSAEFEVDLTRLVWSYRSGTSADTGLTGLSEDLIYMTARAQKFDGFRTAGIGTKSSKRPKYIEVISNILTVVIKPGE
jgi:hypothetical protein